MARARIEGVQVDEERRRLLVDHASLDGIDAVEVGPEPPQGQPPSPPSIEGQKTLRVYFINGTAVDKLALDAEQFRIHGGFRVTDVQVKKVAAVTAPAGLPHLLLTLDRAGDHSRYELELTGKRNDGLAAPLLDPAFRRCAFTFKAACPSPFDCAPQTPETSVALDEAPIDYMARDYESIRRGLLDLLPRISPGWKPRHEADVGVALVELMAYVGDRLAYYQDAVAAEAFLPTARQRVSVRRLARLVDYRIREAISARTFLHVQMKENTGGELGKGSVVLTRIDEPLGPYNPRPPVVIPPAWREEAVRKAHVAFETRENVTLHHKLNEIGIHGWGSIDACLEKGATSAHLVGDLRGHLQPGAFLLFEEVKGGRDLTEADADPTRRQVVRLVEVGATLEEDHLVRQKVPDSSTTTPTLLTRVRWHPEDALRHAFSLSGRRPDGQVVGGATLARGNLVLADHGLTIEAESHAGPPEDAPAGQPRAHRIRLGEGPLSHVVLPRDVSVASLFRQDPREARPEIWAEIDEEGTRRRWDVGVRDALLDHDDQDRRFALECDNDGRAILRFGANGYGRPPPPRRAILVTYRHGAGTPGNVGAESFAHVVPRFPPPEGTPASTPLPPWGSLDSGKIERVRNPLPAWGGLDAEPIEEVREAAPVAMREAPLRAVTEKDYEEITQRHPGVSRAVAAFRWTGSWHAVYVTIDPRERYGVDKSLAEEVKRWLAPYALVGYEIEVEPPLYVPLEIEIEVCARRDHFRADVEEAVLRELGSGVLPDGRRGFFHPDHFTFEQPLTLSRLYAAIDAVEGVESATVLKLVRAGMPAEDELARGYVRADKLEILRLDNDPNHPEYGTLTLTVRGGK